jgi:hypothetical protein
MMAWTRGLLPAGIAGAGAAGLGVAGAGRGSDAPAALGHSVGGPKSPASAGPRAHRRGRNPKDAGALLASTFIYFEGPQRRTAQPDVPGPLAGPVRSAQPRHRHGPIATILRRIVCMFGCARC